MAKKSTKKNESALDYQALRRELKANGPERLYLLYGEEDYLRDSFIKELSSRCLPEGDDGFAYRRMDAAQPNMTELSEAVNALPFATERTMVELRGFDINRCRDQEADALKRIMEDIPEYCTIIIVLDTGYEPDKRIKAVKTVEKCGKCVNFTAQSQGQLMNWIVRRFAALDRDIASDAVAELIMTSGTLMRGLIPEITKIASGSASRQVTVADIRRLASPIPEAQVFAMADDISAGNYDAAADKMQTLIAAGTEPISAVAVIGTQIRRLYAVRAALADGLSREYMMSATGVRFPFILDRLVSSARRMSLGRLARMVEVCCEMDYKMKSSSTDDTELMRELLIRIAAA